MVRLGLGFYNTTLDPSDVLLRSARRLSTRVSLRYVNQQHGRRGFLFRALYSLFYTRPPRWCGTTDTWRRWLLAKNATRVKFISRTLQNPVPCYARVKIPPFLPITATRLRSLAIRPKQFYGSYGDSLASRSAPHIIW